MLHASLLPPGQECWPVVLVFTVQDFFRFTLRWPLEKTVNEITDQQSERAQDRTVWTERLETTAALVSRRLPAFHRRHSTQFRGVHDVSVTHGRKKTDELVFMINFFHLLKMSTFIL